MMFIVTNVPVQVKSKQDVHRSKAAAAGETRDKMRFREDEMDREELISAIKEATINGRLSCETAHRLSNERSVPLQAIGALCNELKIKIADCQLGCF